MPGLHGTDRLFEGPTEQIQILFFRRSIRGSRGLPLAQVQRPRPSPREHANASPCPTNRRSPTKPRRLRCRATSAEPAPRCPAPRNSSYWPIAARRRRKTQHRARSLNTRFRADRASRPSLSCSVSASASAARGPQRKARDRRDILGASPEPTLLPSAAQHRVSLYDACPSQNKGRRPLAGHPIYAPKWPEHRRRARQSRKLSRPAA